MAATMPSGDALRALGTLPGDEPVVVLDMYAFADRGAFDGFRRAAAPLLRAHGAVTIYRSDSFMDPTARPPAPPGGAGAWHEFSLTRYPSPAALRSVIGALAASADAMAGRSAGLRRTVMYAFRGMVPYKAAASGRLPAGHEAWRRNPLLEPIRAQSPEELFVLNLLRFRADGGRKQYQKYGKITAGLQQQGQSKGAVLALKGEVALVSDEKWDDLYMAQYPNLASLLDMNAKPEWVAANKKYRLGDRKLGAGDKQGGGGVDLTWAFPSVSAPHRKDWAQSVAEWRAGFQSKVRAQAGDGGGGARL